MAPGLRLIVNTKSNRKELNDGLEEMRTIRSETKNPTCLLDSSETKAHFFNDYDKRRVF